MPYLSLYLSDRGLDAQSIGWILAVLAGTRIIAPNALGWFADHFGRHIKVIRLGAAIAFIAFLGIFLVDAFTGLLWVVFAFSFFWNGILSQFEAITLESLGTKRDTYGRIRAWGSAGFIFMVIGLGMAFDYLPIRLLPVFIAVLLGLIWLTTLTVPTKQNHKAAKSVASPYRILRNPKVLGFLLVSFLIQVAHAPYYVFFSVYLEGLGYNRSLIGALWATGVVAEILLFLGMHNLFRKHSIRDIALVSLALMTLRWYLTAQFSDTLIVLVVAQALHAFSFGSLHACSMEIVQRFFRPGLEGRGQAYYSSVSFGAGSSVGAIIAGYFWMTNGSNIAFYFAISVSMLALFIAIVCYRGPVFEARAGVKYELT